MPRQFLSNESQTAYVDVRDRDIKFNDVTLGNASESKHGFLPKLSGVATEFLNGVGEFVELGSGGGIALTTDPVDPVDRQWWVVVIAGTPLTTIALRIFLYDEIWTIAGIDVPTP